MNKQFKDLKVEKREKRVSNRKKAKRKLFSFFGNPIYSIAVAVILIIAVTIVTMLVFEKGKNENVNNIFDAIWYAIVTLTTVGYGDISPMTLPGRFFGLIAMVIGVVMFAALSGKIASLLVDIELRRGKGLLKVKRLENHFIICGWRVDFEKIIDGVLSTNPEIDISDIVLINNAPSENIELIMTNPKYKLINYIHGDFIDESVLNRANIKQAAKVLILADTSGPYSPLEIDSRTVMAVLTIESINRKVYTAAELLDEKFEKYLDLAHCDEIILTKEYVRVLLVNASSGSGISHVVRNLLTPDTDTGKIKIDRIPPAFVGQNFSALSAYFKSNHNAILIGVLENTGNFYSRKKEALSEAQKTPDISTIVMNLKKVKDLKANNPILNPGDDYIVKNNTSAILIDSVLA